MKGILSKEKQQQIKNAIDLLLTTDVDNLINSVRLAEYTEDNAEEIYIYIDLLSSEEDVDDILECECNIEARYENLNFMETYPNEEWPPHKCILWERKSGYVI